MEYKIIDEDEAKKNTRYWYATIIIVYILILFFAFWPFIWPSSYMWFDYYVSITMFGVFVGTLIYFYLTHKKARTDKYIMNEKVLKINISDDGITCVGKNEKKFYSYSYLNSEDITVVIQSVNRLYPKLKSFKFKNFLEQEQGSNYIEEGINKIPPSKRDKTQILIEFWSKKNAIKGSKLLFSLMISLKTLPLSELKNMLQELRDKYYAYIKKVEKW